MHANNVIRDTSRALAVGYTATFSSTLVNNFRFGLTRQSQDNNGNENLPIVTFRTFDDLHPSVGSVSPTTSFTRKFHIPVYNWLDDVAWTRGKHTLQFGVNIRRITNTRATDLSNINFANTNPSYLNTPASSNGSLNPVNFGLKKVDPNNSAPYDNAIGNIIAVIAQVDGQYNRTAKGVDIPEGTLVPKNFRSWESNVHVQPTSHIRPTLTITAGLRYSLLQPVYETDGNQVSPNQDLNQYLGNRSAAMALGQTTDEIITYSPSGQANGKKPYWPWDYKDFGPRLAFAYAPNFKDGLLGALFGGSGKTSIRGGVGIVYDHFGATLVGTFDQNGSFCLKTMISKAAFLERLYGGAPFKGINNIPYSLPPLAAGPTGP